MSHRTLRLIGSCAAAAALAGCMVGPNYSRPTMTMAPAFKEQGWTAVQPADLSPRGDWWTIFNDPTLNALESRVNISNQNVAAAEAAYRQSEALVAEQRAALLPTITLNGSGARSGTGSGGGSAVVTNGSGSFVTGGGGRATNNYRVSAGATWAPDLWGRVRRGVEGAHANAQASEADLAGARLSAQATLASDYFSLRELDTEVALLTRTVADYERNLKIAQNRYNAGIAPHSDVLQGQSQLASTQGDLSDLARRRAAFEHAIAVLMGQTPESFTLAADPNWTAGIPQPPAGVPSTLLQRRPDIAAAERHAASASAQIGVETAAYFPDLTLTGSYGFSAAEIGKLFSASASLWTIGASAAETVFNGGLTTARVHAARASYDQAVAQYRQTVLAGLQDVEDQLAATRVLADEYAYRQSAAHDAELATTMVLNQYREGQVDYTAVVVAQVQALNADRTLAQAAVARQTAAVSLIQAIGGGWTAPF